MITQPVRAVEFEATQLDKLEAWLEHERAPRLKPRVVFTNGCFDVLHVGHLRYLQMAKLQGDILVVAINSDDSVRAIKGEKRPLVPEDERAEMLASLECVDYVMVFPELDPIQFLKELRPHIHVKGGDYELSEVIEREAVESIGGEVRLMPGVAGKSTTNLIDLIVERYASSDGSKKPDE